MVLAPTNRTFRNLSEIIKMHFQGKNPQFCIERIDFLLYWNRQHKKNCFGINKEKHLE